MQKEDGDRECRIEIQSKSSHRLPVDLQQRRLTIGLIEIPGLQHNLGVKGPWKTPLRGKVQGRDFSTALGNPATAARFPLFPPPRLRRVNFPNPSRQEIEEKKN